MKRSNLFSTLPVLLLAPVCVQAVTFGEPDGTRHPYVGTIIFQVASGYYSCTATLISPTVLVTAAHCTAENGIRNLNTWVKFTPTISFPGYENYSSLGDYLDAKKNGWLKGEAYPHPNYRDYAQFPTTYDIGVVVLRQAVSMSVYGALPPEGFLTTIRSAADNKFTVVGYGMQGYIKPFVSDTYARYQGKVRLIELESTFDAGLSAKFSNNPGSGGGSCYGDSGGPIFYGNTNMIVAVVNWGITPCIGVDYQFRLDTRTAQDFLQKYLE
jgi:secreted trypsin-like serine protease